MIGSTVSLLSDVWSRQRSTYVKGSQASHGLEARRMDCGEEQNVDSDMEGLRRSLLLNEHLQVFMAVEGPWWFSRHSVKRC